jgi:hypothetical protein
MELVLSSIAAGGLVGAADQYMCLLIVAACARVGWIKLTPALSFMDSWWFIAIIVAFWLVTVAPSYASLLSPGVLHVVNTVVNFLSGFVVPASSALIALASTGVIASTNPDMQHVLETLMIFDPHGHLGPTGVAIAAASGITALAITGSKGLAKPALSASTGTMGTAAAPIFTTVENVASLVLLGVAYALSRVSPWLIVVLLAVVVALVLGFLVFALVQLWRLKKGIGRVLNLAQTYPRAGLAVMLEFFVWGSGWLIWAAWGRGAVMLAAWLGWLTLFALLPVVVGGILVFVPPLIGPVLLLAGMVMLLIFGGVGFNSARALLRKVEDEVPQPAAGRRAEA